VVRDETVSTTDIENFVTSFQDASDLESHVISATNFSTSMHSFDATRDWCEKPIHALSCSASRVPNDLHQVIDAKAQLEEQPESNGV
jgi:hypothetical protein